MRVYVFNKVYNLLTYGYAMCTEDFRLSLWQFGGVRCDGRSKIGADNIISDAARPGPDAPLITCTSAHVGFFNTHAPKNMQCTVIGQWYCTYAGAQA